jgi:hypothetical protein
MKTTQVTPETYIRAESDRQFGVVAKMAGGVNRFCHFRHSSNVKLNADGNFTVYFGSPETCGEVPNRLDTTEGWNFIMRIYRPGKSVLEGAYNLPAAKPVK